MSDNKKDTSASGELKRTYDASGRLQDRGNEPAVQEKIADKGKPTITHFKNGK